MQWLYEATKGYKRTCSIIIVAVIAVLQWMGLIDAELSAKILMVASTLGLYGVFDANANPTK